LFSLVHMPRLLEYPVPRRTALIAYLVGATGEDHGLDERTRKSRKVIEGVRLSRNLPDAALVAGQEWHLPIVPALIEAVIAAIAQPFILTGIVLAGLAHAAIRVNPRLAIVLGAACLIGEVGLRDAGDG